MPEFQVGDVVRVELPRGYSNRGILGISVLFNTSPESRFEGAIGTVAEINPVGPQSVHQYLVDFRTHDNSRVGIPWQAQWFREEWLALKERPEAAARAATQTPAPEATWPERPASAEPATAGAAAGGIAHPEAKIYTEGKRDFAPEGLDPSQATGTVPPAAYGIGSREAAAQGEAATGAGDERDSGKFYPSPESAGSPLDRSAAPGGTGNQGSGVSSRSASTGAAPEVETSQGFTGPDRVDDRSALDQPTFEPTLESMTSPVDTTTPSSAPGSMGVGGGSATAGGIVEQGEGYVRVDGSQRQCPEGYPVKGNAGSGIYHLEGMASYERTIPEICFDSPATAEANGYRPPRGRQPAGGESTEQADMGRAQGGSSGRQGDERDPGKFYASPESAGSPIDRPASTGTGGSTEDMATAVAEPVGLVSEVTIESTIFATETPSGDLIVERGEGFVRVRGMSVCPDGYPIKGNANSGIFHAPTDNSYQRTTPEICFASEDVAIANGFRPPSRRG